MQPIKETFKDTSFNLAKALHHNKISQEYFELLKIGTTGETKMLFQNCKQRLEWAYKNIYDRLGESSRNILKEEMTDSLSFDAIMDNLVLLTPENRAVVEGIITSLSKGESIELVQINNY